MIRMLRLLWMTVAAFACVLSTGTPVWAQFETRGTTALPPGAFSIAAGDFSRDGKLGIAVMGDRGLSVALGNGDGTFQRATSFPYDLGDSVAVGDFNGDGNLDLAVTAYAYSTEVFVFLGNGDGTFQPPIASPTTEFPIFVAVGDFNGDHKLDIAIVDPPYVSVLLGNGDGTFQPPIDNDSFGGPDSLAVGEFTNDHRLGVVVVGSPFGSAAVGVLLGNGDGTLRNSLTYSLPYTTNGVAVGQFIRGGPLDVVVGGLVTVFLGNGDGTLQFPGFDTGMAGPPVVGDFNGDGDLDVAAPACCDPQGLSVALGNGDGTFESPQTFAAGETGLPVVGDFNNDRKPDVVFANLDVGAVTLLNTGVASFSPTTPLVFGKQLINTASRPQIVTLTNSGKWPLSITSIRASGQFGVSSTCGDSLAAGKSCEVSAIFKPTTPGKHTGMVTLVDSSSPKPEVIELRGVGER